MTGRPTVHEVARTAGVSIATVSRVLNGKGGSPRSEQLVRKAVLDLGYVPDALGRALKLGRSLQVAFAVDDLSNPVYTQMMRGVEEGLAASGGRLLVSSTGHRVEDLLELVRSFERGYADGLVISPLVRTPELVAALVDASVPVVVIGALPDGTPLDLVRTDSVTGIGMALEHVVAIGRRDVVFVNGPEHTAPGAQRRAGFEAAAAREGVTARAVVAGEFTIEGGEGAWAQIEGLSLGACDAVVAANDVLALGVMRAAMSSGRRVPDDLVVTGMDDIPFGRAMSPSLTTVSLQARERGRLAAQLLVDRIGSPRQPPRAVTLQPQLVVRESTGAPRGR